MFTSKLSLAVLISAIVFSSLNTFASFNSDYKDFILEVVQHVPAHSTFDPNVMSGSLAVSFDTTQDEKMSVDAVVKFAGQLDKTSKNIAVNLSASGSYTTQSGTQFIDTAGQSIIVSNQGGVSKLYVTLGHLKTNIPQLQDDSIQSITNKLISNWYVGTGDTSDSFGIDKTLSKGSFVPSIAGDNLNAQVKFYQQIIKYPIITPVGSQGADGIYNIKLNKKNTAQIMTLIATSQHPEMTATDRNEIRRGYTRSMTSVASKGTFDPANNHIKINLSSKGNKTSLDITPQSVNITAKDTSSLATAKVTWDRDMISLDANGSQNTITFKAHMVANQSHVEISGSYTDESSKGTAKLLVDTASTAVTVSEPKDALPMSDLSL